MRQKRTKMFCCIQLISESPMTATNTIIRCLCKVYIKEKERDRETTRYHRIPIDTSAFVNADGSAISMSDRCLCCQRWGALFCQTWMTKEVTRVLFACSKYTESLSQRPPDMDIAQPWCALRSSSRISVTISIIIIIISLSFSQTKVFYHI